MRVGGLVKTAASVIGGAVGSKMIPQAVLGSKNTGVMGYLANVVSGGLLAWGAKAFMRDTAISQGILVGTAVQVILRVIGDNTQFGSFLSLSGLGDYMAWNGAAPQTLVDGLNSPEVRIDRGWGGSMMSPVLNTGTAGMGSLRQGRALY